MTSWTELETAISEIFEGAGVRTEDSRVTAANLVCAEQMGILSHGLIRVSAYVSRLLKGGINPRPQVGIVRQEGAVAVVDGDNGLGQISAAFAMGAAIRIADESGVGFVHVRNGSHFGMAGFYSLMASDQDMIGFASSNTSAVMAPTGGRERMVGNNPISIAIPSSGPFPILVDMAISVTALGKFLVAAQNGESIPLGWALDRNGVPTQDPSEALKGSVLPIAGYKGYGLALVVDVLTGLLADGNFGPAVGSLISGDPASPNGNSFAFLALDPARFLDRSRFKDLVLAMTTALKASQRAEGIDEILLPGEREFKSRQRAAASGPSINESVRQQLLELSRKLSCRSAERAFELLTP